MKFAKIMMAAVVAVGTMFMITGCGREETPTQALKNLDQALKKGDMDTANKYFITPMENAPSKDSGMVTRSITYVKEEVNGDTAIVHIIEHNKIEVEMKKINGVWKCK